MYRNFTVWVETSNQSVYKIQCVQAKWKHSVSDRIKVCSYIHCMMVVKLYISGHCGNMKVRGCPYLHILSLHLIVYLLSSVCVCLYISYFCINGVLYLCISVIKCIAELIDAIKRFISRCFIFLSLKGVSKKWAALFSLYLGSY